MKGTRYGVAVHARVDDGHAEARGTGRRRAERRAGDGGARHVSCDGGVVRGHPQRCDGVVRRHEQQHASVQVAAPQGQHAVERSVEHAERPRRRQQPVGVVAGTDYGVLFRSAQARGRRRRRSSVASRPAVVEDHVGEGQPPRPSGPHQTRFGGSLVRPA